MKISNFNETVKKLTKHWLNDKIYPAFWATVA